MIKNTQKVFKTSPLFWFKQSRIPLVLLSIFVISLFIYFLFSIPKPKPIDPLDPVNYSYKLQKIKILDYLRTIVHDIDEDGIFELLGFDERSNKEDDEYNSIHLCNQQGFEMEQFNVNGILSPVYAWISDINDNGEKEILFCETIRDSIFIHIRTLNDEPLFKFFAVTKDEYTRPHKYWRCSIVLLDFVDINDDGRKDIITCIHTPEASSPRGVYVFDYVTGGIIWSYKMGAAPNQRALVTDIDNDGRNEILFGTCSYGNVREPRNGTDDFHNYFFVFDFNSKDRVFKHEFGYARGMNVLFQSGDLTGDDKLEFIVMHDIYWPELAKQSKIFKSDLYLFNPRMKRLVKKLEFSSSFRGMIVSDIENDGKDELIMTDVDGVTSIYKYDGLTGNFNKEKQFSLKDKLSLTSVCIYAIEDLNNDGINEMIMTSEESLIILDNDFNVLALIDFPDHEIFIVNCGLSAKKILYPKENRAYLLELKKNTDYYMRIFSRYALVWPVGLIIISMSLIFIIIVNNHKNEMIGSDNYVIILDKKHRISFINKNFQELLGVHKRLLQTKYLNDFIGQENVSKLFSLLEKLDKEGLLIIEDEIIMLKSDQKKHMRIQILPINGNHRGSNRKVILFSDQSESLYTNHVLTWGSMAQQLAHEIKNPLSAILLNLKRIQQMINKDIVKESYKYNRYMNAITEEIERLRNATNAFMKFSDSSRMNLQLCDVKETIEQILIKLNIQSSKTKHVTFKSSKDILRIRADQEMITLALSNIILNAWESLGDKGEISIIARDIERIDEKSNYINDFVQIEVMDTGEGIKKEYLEKIFQPGFTTKPGGAGFGLAIARHIVISHKGYIELSSEGGSGTVVSIDLPFE